MLLVIKKAPFLLQEQGWGEFDMTIELTLTDKSGVYTVAHDLNFEKNVYEKVHNLVGTNCSRLFNV
jgi:transcription initiation factor TFIID/TFIIF subunit